MIEMVQDTLRFAFPEVDPRAVLTVDFQRTLRLPDDGRTHPLPPGLGRFPLRHVDDYASRVPHHWARRGGVMMPMWQSEAMWLSFTSSWPFAVKVAAGKINALTGDPWVEGLRTYPQDYLVAPNQPWLDGFAVSRGVIRQFVAMPLGSGWSAEEQITGRGEVGGLQLIAIPMTAAAHHRRFGQVKHRRAAGRFDDGEACGAAAPCSERTRDMGLAPGGRMQQEVYADGYGIEDWDRYSSSRCFVHLMNAEAWWSATGGAPPTKPFDANDYRAHGMPWFTFYADGERPLSGSPTLDRLRPVGGDVRVDADGRRVVDLRRDRDFWRDG